MDLKAADRHGSSVLHMAASSRQRRAAQAPHRGGADVKVRDRTGQTPLASLLGGTAYRSGDKTGEVRLLLKAGAKVDAQDNYGFTPLMYAVRANDRRIAMLLLCRGAQVDQRDNKGSTALLHAVIFGDPAMIKLLLRRGAGLAALAESGLTVLVRLLRLVPGEDLAELLKQNADKGAWLRGSAALLRAQPCRMTGR